MGVRVLNRSTGGVFSPLVAGHSKKREIVSTGNTINRDQHEKRQFQKSFSSLYVGENFTVDIPFSMDLTHLVTNTSMCGFVTTDFFPHKSMQTINLTAGGSRLLSVPNAGGSSVISEVLSFEVLGRCFGATLKKTEMEISYFPKGGSMTDYVCEVSHTTVGVSVTRAWKYHGDYNLEDASHLLNKKLRGVIQSTRNSTVRWNKQILHVWSASEFVTNTLAQAYCDLDPEVKANTVVIVSTARQADYIFKNSS